MTFCWRLFFYKSVELYFKAKFFAPARASGVMLIEKSLSNGDSDTGNKAKSKRYKKVVEGSIGEAKKSYGIRPITALLIVCCKINYVHCYLLLNLDDV